MLERIKDAVQPLAWYKALPRKEYESYRHVMTHESWYEVYDLGTDTYAIYEPGHFQEVISYLILGDEKALLLDTGMGICPIKPLVDKLTSLPLIAVNSHCHFDHVGGNWEFPSVHIFNHPAAVSRLRKGLGSNNVAHHLTGDSTWIPYPVGFDADSYEIKPCNCIPVNDGHLFELGGRTLEVIHTPGHSPDSIMLLDKPKSILFTGDTFYPASMYTHLSSEDGIDSDFDTYRTTITELSGKLSVDYLYTCHNYPVVDGSILRDFADALEAIASGKLNHLIDDGNLKKYQFNGFAIICK